jgi:hypothetical protein
VKRKVMNMRGCSDRRQGMKLEEERIGRFS